MQRWAKKFYSSITDSESIKYKERFLDNTDKDGTINSEIAVPLKGLSDFWRTLKIPLNWLWN